MNTSSERSVQRDFCKNKKFAAADRAAYVLGSPDDDGLLNITKGSQVASLFV